MRDRIGRGADMRRRLLRTVGSLLIVSLVSLPAPGWAEEPRILSLDGLRIPYEHRHGVYVITGKGRRVLELPAKRARGNEGREGNRKLEYAYYTPDVHPSQERIVCLRCHAFFEQDYRRDVRCEVVEIILHEKKSPVRVIYAPPEGGAIASPVWSPGGRRIAFFIFEKGENSSRGIAILDMESRKALQRISVGQLEAGVYSDYLRWAADGKQIFIWGGRPNPGYFGIAGQDAAVLTVDSGHVRWLGQWVGTGLYAIRPIDGKYTEEGKFEKGEWKREIETPADAEAVRTLFGSSENQVSRPIWSPDRRYYFYKRIREGFGAKGWIERYDTQTHERDAIKTVWRAVYVE